MTDQTCPKPCPDCRWIVDDLRNQLADEKSSHKCTLEASLDYRDRCFTAEAEVTRLRGLLGDIEALNKDQRVIGGFPRTLDAILSCIDQPEGDHNDQI